MVQSSKCCPNEWSNPEYPMVIPSEVLVVNEGCTKTPSWVDTSSCDRNGGQVNQKHCKPNRQWCQDRNMGIPGISLGISGREDSVDKHKGANNLCSKAITLGISMTDGIGSTTKPLVLVFLEALYHSSTTDSSQALHYHVKTQPWSARASLPTTAQKSLLG